MPTVLLCIIGKQGALHMRKLSKKHQFAINQIMLATISQYVQDFAVGADEDILMYADDVAYNSKILKEFNVHLNAAKLHDAVLMQDTIVREYFIDVLQYIEGADLIPAHQFA
jgi:hypothetical protein